MTFAELRQEFQEYLGCRDFDMYLQHKLSSSSGRKILAELIQTEVLDYETISAAVNSAVHSVLLPILRCRDEMLFDTALAELLPAVRKFTDFSHLTADPREFRFALPSLYRQFGGVDLSAKLQQLIQYYDDDDSLSEELLEISKTALCVCDDAFTVEDLKLVLSHEVLGENLRNGLVTDSESLHELQKSLLENSCKTSKKL